MLDLQINICNDDLYPTINRDNFVNFKIIYSLPPLLIIRFYMYILSIITSFLLSLPIHSSTINEVKVMGHDFPTEEAFSRRLKSDYDIIQKRWSYLDENTIQLDAYHLDDNKRSLPTDFQFEGEKKTAFLNKDNIKYINFGVPLTFIAYGALFWDWGKVNGFNFRDEGWFTKNTYAGGTDKIAHMYSHYLINRSSYYLYRNSGLSHNDALRNSFILATSIGILIEIGDGISHYGFALNDLIADMAGIGLGHLLNQNAYLDELIGFQMWWWSDDTATGNHKKGTRLKDPIDDYNNQKYVFNFRMAAVPFLRDFIVTRYLNLDIGYYSRGYKDPTNINGRTERTLYTGASLNLSQLIRDFFPNSDFAYGVATASRYYQVPYTSYEVQGWVDRD